MFGQKLMARWVVAAGILGGLAVLVSPKIAEAQTIVYKQCSHCNKMVPITSQVGDTCPYCGAYWGSEQKEYVPGGDSHSSPRYIPTPWEQMALYRAMLQHEEMLREQQRRQEIYARCEKQRRALAAERQKVYQQNRENTEFFHQHDDPEQRGKRYLASAANRERERDWNRAAAYYRLTVRSLPGTLAAAKASDALERLGYE